MKYILQNIPFFVALGVLGAVLVTVFFTRMTSTEHKKSLRHEFCFCSLLCLLTLLCDCLFFASIIHQKTLEFIALHGYFWGTFVAITSYIFAMLAFTGLFICLRALPLAGKGLMWLTWCLITIPIRLYYLVTGLMPSGLDVMNLFTVKLHTTLDTLSTFLNISNIFAASFPNIVIIAVMYIIFRQKLSQSFKLSAFFIGLLIFTVYCINPKGDSVLRDSMGSSIRLVRGVILGFRNYFIPRENFYSDMLQDKPHNNVVFILDESIRGDYLTINNPNIDTTPKLAQYIYDYPDNIFNYGLMLSAATTSFASRITLMTALNRLPDTDMDEFKKPTIFDIAKANNYKTILINIQGDLPDGTFRAPDMSKADEIYLSGNDFEKVTGDGDMDAAAFLHKRLLEENRLFIFIEKQGAHVPYQKRYPAGEAQHNIFKPSLEPDEWYSVQKRSKIINSYKNAVRYNIDGFFAQLFGDDITSLKNCTIIYTSDHGQSFMEYGQPESHGTTYLEQAIVPFMVFSTDSWVLENLKRPAEIPYTLHHMNIAPTLRAILCRDSEYDSGMYSSLLSKEFRKPKLSYIMRGSPIDCELSPEISSDTNGKIILPLDKYMY